MRKALFALLITIAVIFTSCSGGNDESQEQLLSGQSKDAQVPVRVEKVESESFRQYQSYTSVLNGSNEVVKNSALSGVIEDVLFETGDFVQKDEIVLTFPKETSSAQYYQSRASYEAAEKTFSRMKNLYNSNSISRQEYEQAKTQYDVQRANWKAVSDMVEVKAPVSGYITLLSVNASDSVSQGDSLFTISNYQTLTATISVPDRFIKDLSVDQDAEAIWEGNTVFGKVTRVNLSKDSRHKAFTVQLAFGNPDFIIPSGVTAKIRINTMINDDVIVLHRDQFLTDHSGAYAFVLNNGKAEKRDLQLGRHHGFYYEIESGLTENDILIIEGLLLLENQSDVTVING